MANGPRQNPAKVADEYSVLRRQRSHRRCHLPPGWASGGPVSVVRTLAHEQVRTKGEDATFDDGLFATMNEFQEIAKQVQADAEVLYKAAREGVA